MRPHIPHCQRPVRKHRMATSERNNVYARPQSRNCLPISDSLEDGSCPSGDKVCAFRGRHSFARANGHRKVTWRVTNAQKIGIKNSSWWFHRQNRGHWNGRGGGISNRTRTLRMSHVTSPLWLFNDRKWLEAGSDNLRATVRPKTSTNCISLKTHWLGETNSNGSSLQAKFKPGAAQAAPNRI